MRRNLVTGLCGMLLMGAAAVPSSFAADQTGYDKGFFIRSADDNFSVKLNHLASFGYQYQNNDPAANTSGFSFRQARPELSGNVFGQDWTYHISLEMATGAVTLLDYNANWKHCDAFNFKFGQFKVPFSREGLAALNHITTISRSLNNAANGGEFFEPGVSIWGTLADKMFEYALSATNGNGVNGTQGANDIDMRWSGRFVLNLMGNHGLWYGDMGNSSEPHANIGLGANWNRLDSDVDGSFDDLMALTADAGFAYQGFDVVVAYYLTRRDLSTAGETTDHAFDAIASYFIMPEKAELGAHLAWSEPDAGFRTIQAGPVLNWYLHGRDARLQFQYDYTSADTAGDPVSHQFTAQAQFGF